MCVIYNNFNVFDLRSPFESFEMQNTERNVICVVCNADWVRKKKTATKYIRTRDMMSWENVCKWPIILMAAIIIQIGAVVISHSNAYFLWENITYIKNIEVN